MNDTFDDAFVSLSHCLSVGPIPRGPRGDKVPWGEHMQGRIRQGPQQQGGNTRLHFWQVSFCLRQAQASFHHHLHQAAMPMRYRCIKGLNF